MPFPNRDDGVVDSPIRSRVGSFLTCGPAPHSIMDKSSSAVTVPISAASRSTTVSDGRSNSPHGAESQATKAISRPR